jgi:hypothetical protein
VSTETHFGMSWGGRGAHKAGRAFTRFAYG